MARTSRRGPRIPWRTIFRILIYIVIVVLLFKYGERVLYGILDLLHM
ncbi:MAG TPA: hypothetical protein VHQ04_01930 [Puia sp.]|jgi:hypothetical protein|nr:hypothetical protein [Puia sp.]